MANILLNSVSKTNPHLPLMDRFWHRVMPEPNTGCWFWLGSLSPGPSKDRSTGYGRIKVGDRTMLAHIFSYETFVGKVPNGLELDHKCRMPSCVNPDHLEPVTHKENVRRGNASKSWSSMLKAKTHCKRGHPYSGENLYITPKGGRACKECQRTFARDFYRKKHGLG